MRYQPKTIEGNDNVSPGSPLALLAWLLGGAATLLVALYIAAGFFGDAVAAVAPASLERAIGEAFIKGLPRRPGESPRLASLRALAERVRAAAGAEGPVEVFLVETREANAFALPGGKVVVLAGLLEEAESENEVALVLAHEFGHIAHKDALRGLGRSLVLVAAASLVVGSEEATSRLFGGALQLGQLKYSREQEREADRYALAALANLYGHTGGAEDFFRRQAGKRGGAALPEFASTHPDPSERAASIGETSARQGWPVKSTIPKPEEWRVVEATE